MSGLIRDDGECVRFKLPVLLLGASPAADVQLDGTADFHALFSPTPVGPAIRSFSPETTLVNGEPTAAALLKDGDVVAVGEHRFTVSWPAIEDQTAPVHELLAERTAHVESLLAQLAEQREAFRAEKAGIKTRLKEIEKHRQDAKQVHERTRAAAAKYLQEHRATIQEQQRALLEQRGILQSRQDQIEDQHKHLAVEQERFRGEVELSNQRIAAAWAAMTAAQQQLASERTQTEQELAAQLNILDARRTEIEKREAAIEANTKAATGRLAALQSELAGMEQRATHARMALADLEQQRLQKMPAEPIHMAAEDWSAPVPLNRHDTRTADQLLVQLRQQEHELGKERQRLAAQLQHAATEREHLHDQRALVAEQIRQLEATRRQWQAAETQTVAELEQLGTSLAVRESELEARTNSILLAERERKANEEKLADYRKTLDDWRASLTAQESRFVSERQKTEVELAARSG